MSARIRKSPSPGRLGTKNEKSKERQPAGSKNRGWRTWLPLLALLLVTLAVYYPAWHGGMLWDDDSHITRTDLRTWDGLRRIWFDLEATQQYYPLVHSAFWIQHKLWGDDMLGYHLFNIALHALCAFLVGLILKRLAAPGAWLAAVIFALHPVHVESVAWVTELKNTLSGLFYLGAALVYLRYDEDRLRRHYAAALVLFVLALLSKTVAATLPAALLVVFWWRRGRLEWRGDAVPLLPFFALGVSGGLLTAYVERTLIGAQGAEFQFTLIERCLIAGRAIWFYLGKLLLPVNLMFIYPRWQVSQGIWWQYLFPAGVMALLFGAWWLRRLGRGPLAALLLFCGTLFPVLGFFNVFPFKFSFVADHFQYLASIPIIALFAAGLARLARRWKIPSRTAAAGIAALGLLLAIPTWSLSRRYADAGTLYRATLDRNPSCWMAHVNLGKLQLDGPMDEAIAHFKEALRLKPDLAEAHHNLGNVLQRMGRLEEAVPEYREALRLKPDFAETHNNLGNALRKLGRLEEAVAECKEALGIQADYPDAHFNLGVSLQQLDRLPEAEAHLEAAVKLAPDFAEAHNDLGNVLQRMNRFEEAAVHMQEALRLKPDLLVAHYNLGNVLQRLGRMEEAAAHYREALRLKPDFAFAHNNLGSALLGMGRVEEAATHFREALRLLPGYREAQANLARAAGMGK